MLAFTDTEVTKEQLIGSLRAHAAKDRIAQGIYWTSGKGCAVGCSIHDFAKGKEREHAQYERLFGIPRLLAHLEDRVFEGLTVEESRGWPMRFVEAIRPGADLEMVWPRFAVWLLRGLPPSKRDAVNAVDRVAKLYEAWVAGNKPSDSDFSAAYAAAYAAYAAAYAAYAADAAAYAADAAAYAAYAAYAAAYAADAAAYAAYAADAAAYAADAAAYAAYAAYAAADAADAAADAAAARTRFWRSAADKLVELLQAA